MSKYFISFAMMMWLCCAVSFVSAQNEKGTIESAVVSIKDLYIYDDGSTKEVETVKEGVFTEEELDGWLSEAKSIPSLQSRIIEARFRFENGNSERRRYYFTNVEPAKEPAKMPSFITPDVDLPEEYFYSDSLSFDFPGFDFEELTERLREMMGESFAFTPMSSGAYLGVQTSDNESKGVLVRSVMPESPAEKAGILEGDLVISIDDEEVRSSRHLQQIIRGKNVDDVVKIILIRNQYELTLFADLTANAPSFDIQQFDFPFPPLNMETPPQEESGQWPFKKKKGVFGVTVVEMDNYDGLKVSEIEKDSPAEKAGLQIDDVIYKFDGKKIQSANHFKSLVKDKSGETVKVRIKRDGKSMNLKVEIDSIHE